jgi:hypothetical protein
MEIVANLQAEIVKVCVDLGVLIGREYVFIPVGHLLRHFVVLRF